MSYKVLARKWRPKDFSEVVGQEHVTRALINALKQQRLHHAYLFTGTRGIGKTTLARILAKCLNCETGITDKPCGKCSACQEIDQGRFIDLIEVDAASRTKVEDTRELLDNVQYAPTRGRFKVYLIDEVHMLSGHSFNALLKTLEEPPEHVKFLLATTDPQKLPITVLSRCLQFNLKNIAPEKISQHLQHVLTQEKIEFEMGAIEQLAKAADGSIRDGLSLLDQVIAYGDHKVTKNDVAAMLGTIEDIHIYELLTALAEKNPQQIFMNIINLSEQAADFDNVLDGVISALHHSALLQMIPDSYHESWGDATMLQKLAKQFTPEDIQLYYQIALIGKRDLPLAPSLKMGFEMLMLRMLAFCPNESKSKIQQVAETNISAANWPNLLKQLNLTGSTKALAQHCSIKKIGDNSVELMIHSQHAAMMNQKHEQRLSEAFSSLLKKPISVTISVVNETITTPEKIATTERQKKQQHAEHVVNSDENIQALINNFNATIIPGSISNNEER